MLAKPLDYSKIFWQLQRWFPHDNRFNADNFGYQPEWLILQAYEAGKRMEREELHNQELGIAKLTQLYLNAHLNSKTTQPLSVDSFYHFSDSTVETKLTHEAADAFYDLVKDKKIPQWGLAIAPLEELKQVKTGFKPSYPRGAIGVGLVILNPVIKDGLLTGTLAIIDEGKTEEWVINTEDERQKLLIKVEQERTFEGCYVIEPRFEIVENYWRN